MNKPDSYLKDAQSLIWESKKQYNRSKTRTLRALRKIKSSRKVIESQLPSVS